METILFNAGWMGLNVVLAVIPVIFCFLAQKTRKLFLKYIFLIAWLIFVPNTLYIASDVIHIPEQLADMNLIERLILIVQYLLLEITGFVTFILSLHFFEKTLNTLKVKNRVIRSEIIIANFFIGLGIMLGRVERVNSWELVSDPGKILNSMVNIFSSSELILQAILFGIAANILYFIFKERVVKFAKVYLIKSI